MASMDIFRSNAFSTVSMTEGVNLIDFKPSFLGGLGLFRPRPIRTKTVAVEQREDTLSVVQTSERGAPPTERSRGPRQVRDFRTRRIKLHDRITADEVQDIRAFGSESELQQVASEVAERQALLIDDIELTWENQLLGCVQGVVTDADGSVIVDYFAEFGIAQPAEIALDLANTADNALYGKIVENVVRPIERAGKGLVTTDDPIIGLTGDAAFDELIQHPAIRDVIKRDPSQAQLLLQRRREINFAGVRFVNYRGTDDASTVAVPTDEIKFFPASNRVFEIAFSPGESFDLVNRRGTPLVSMVIPDRDRDEWVDVEVASYFLPACKRPQTLLRARRGV